MDHLECLFSRCSRGTEWWEDVPELSGAEVGAKGAKVRAKVGAGEDCADVAEASDGGAAKEGGEEAPAPLGTKVGAAANGADNGADASDVTLSEGAPPTLAIWIVPSNSLILSHPSEIL